VTLIFLCYTNILAYLLTHTCTTTLQPLSGTTQVGRYQKKHSPTHTQPDHQKSFISFLHLLWSIVSSLFNLCAWQSFSTTSLQVLFGFLLIWNPLLHTACISSPSRYLLFATHAHTVAACLLLPAYLSCYIQYSKASWQIVCSPTHFSTSNATVCLSVFNVPHSCHSVAVIVFLLKVEEYCT